MDRDDDADRGSDIRLADLLVGLSAVADLGMGQPVGRRRAPALSRCRLARVVGCDERTVSDVYFAALLQHVGCTAYSHEATSLFADELSIKRASLATDFDRPREVVFSYLPTIVRDAPVGERLRTARGALLHGRRVTDGYSRANCEVASVVARRLGLSAAVQTGLLDIYESWNGNGRPNRRRGDAISAVARIVTVAGVAALFDRCADRTLHEARYDSGRGGCWTRCSLTRSRRRRRSCLASPQRLMSPTCSWTWNRGR